MKKILDGKPQNFARKARIGIFLLQVRMLARHVLIALFWAILVGIVVGEIGYQYFRYRVSSIEYRMPKSPTPPPYYQTPFEKKDT